MCSQISVRETTCPWRCQEFEQGEFTGTQVDNLPAAAHRSSRRVEFQISHTDGGRLRVVLAPHQGPHTCEQLGKVERLYQVVIGAGVEASHPVCRSVLGRQYQDMGPLAGAVVVA